MEKFKALDNILTLKTSVERLEIQFANVCELLAASQRDINALQRENERLEDTVMSISEHLDAYINEIEGALGGALGIVNHGTPHGILFGGHYSSI